MVELQRFEKKDIDTVLNWTEGTTPEFLMQWAGPSFSHPLTEYQILDYLSTIDNDKERTTLFYKIINQDTDKMVGIVQLGKINKDHLSARIGKFLVGDEGVRNKGIGQQVLRKLFEIGFADLGLHKVTLGVFDFNEQAIHTYEKAGMKKDGLLRDHVKVGDTYWDMYEMSILEEEWRAMYSKTGTA